ncbi:succinylglutamate desuccinylase/aspartoacylase family protein [Candidatus Peregrinibacteria bacterium]|nr:succinylglutamate desuccinylase/aspartoacylase family protein [Candidatus Peregrinibacteria bacterium]
MNTLEVSFASDIYHFSGTKKGPTVVIIGGVHGNERVGVYVIEALKKSFMDEKVCGNIYLIIGNPKAYEKNVRYIDCDLNRLFGYNFYKLANKNPQQLLLEEKRALEIGPILAKADYLLDIHSTIKPSIPFVYIKNTSDHLALARFFETQYIVSCHSDYKIANLGHAEKRPCHSKSHISACSLHSSCDTFVDQHGGLGITFEAGWHQDKDPSIFPQTLAKTKEFLKTIGVAFTSLPDKHFTHEPNIYSTMSASLSTVSAKHIFIYQEIVPQSSSFVFLKDYHNFDFVQKGETLAQDVFQHGPKVSDKKIIVQNDSYIIFPKLDIRVGKIACYLASTDLTPSSLPL